MNKIIVSLAVVFASLIVPANLVSASAVAIPNFTDCNNPQGTLKVSYDNGAHGIVGTNGTQNGRDKVFMISDTALTQCFCPDSDPIGTQTDWWKADSLDPEQIKFYVSQGWNLVLDGSLWGLDKAPYLAKNHTFNCPGSGGGTGGGGSSSNTTTTSTNFGGIGGGGEVLGLATTGNSVQIVGFLAAALLSLSIGLILKKRSNQ